MVLAGQLAAANLDHVVWIEEPENIPTAIAVVPYTKEQTVQVLGKLRLYK